MARKVSILFYNLLKIGILLSGLWAASTASYLRWLWDVSPEQPNASTGQLIRLKNVFITANQAQILSIPFYIIPIIIALSIVFLVKRQSNQFFQYRGISVLVVLTGIILLTTTLGAHIVAFISTGTFVLSP